MSRKRLGTTGLESAVYNREVMEDMCGIGAQTLPITAFIANKSVVEALKSTKLVDDKQSIKPLIAWSVFDASWLS